MFTRRSASRKFIILSQNRRPVGLIFLPQMFRLSLMTIASLFAVTIGLKLGQEEYHDPFAAYETIMPGQSAAHLSEFSCQSADQPMQHGYGVVSDTSHCAIFPRGGVFHLVEAEVKAGMIHQLTFYADSLRLGDVALHWGRIQHPVKKADSSLVFIWDTNAYRVQAQSNRMSYQDTLRIVTVIPGLQG